VSFKYIFAQFVCFTILGDELKVKTRTIQLNSNVDSNRSYTFGASLALYRLIYISIKQQYYWLGVQSGNLIKEIYKIGNDWLLVEKGDTGYGDIKLTATNSSVSNTNIDVVFIG